MENFEKYQHELNNVPTPDQLKTFDDMVNYLKTIDNCRVECEWFIIPDLHSYMNKAIMSVETFPIGERKTSDECIRIKETMKLVIKAIMENKTKPLGHVEKIDFTNFGK